MFQLDDVQVVDAPGAMMCQWLGTLRNFWEMINIPYKYTSLYDSILLYSTCIYVLMVSTDWNVEYFNKAPHVDLARQRYIPSKQRSPWPIGTSELAPIEDIPGQLCNLGPWPLVLLSKRIYPWMVFSGFCHLAEIGMPLQGFFL